ncbi:MAG: hypothetical protein HOP08_08895 [Cyclobacteriaceae bacterium]|nr:hypothetical protein [Cyclobacteriaceae bacterium]
MKNLFTMVFSFVVLVCSAQEPSDVVLTDFIRDSQQWVKEGEKMNLSWWIPSEYWKISLAGNTQIPPGTSEKLEMIFKDYMLICAAEATIHLDGAIEVNDESTIRKSIKVMDASGKTYSPLSEDQLSDEARSVAQNLKPVFAQALGQLGKGMHIFFFSIKNDKSENLIFAAKPGVFKVIHDNSTFNWSLPLASLLPPKICPVDKEKLKGNWNFCPVHGNKL